MKALDPNEVLAIIGLVLLAVGLWFIYAPLAPTVVGALLIAYAVLPDRHPEEKP